MMFCEMGKRFAPLNEGWELGKFSTFLKANLHGGLKIRHVFHDVFRFQLCGVDGLEFELQFVNIW